MWKQGSGQVGTGVPSFCRRGALSWYGALDPLSVGQRELQPTALDHERRSAAYAIARR
jgi:hypothetical protein